MPEFTSLDDTPKHTLRRKRLHLKVWRMSAISWRSAVSWSWQMETMAHTFQTLPGGSYSAGMAVVLHAPKNCQKWSCDEWRGRACSVLESYRYGRRLALLMSVSERGAGVSGLHRYSHKHLGLKRADAAVCEMQRCPIQIKLFGTATE